MLEEKEVRKMWNEAESGSWIAGCKKGGQESQGYTKGRGDD
jgi:hypothetical protein